MVNIVHCKQCGNSSIPMNAVSVNVRHSKGVWCEHCGQAKTETEDYFFCSENCFWIYMWKVLHDKAELKMPEWKIVNGTSKFE
jgi:endogenous inhibitor of DNA gyrase (YacG/DUF329 family)